MERGVTHDPEFEAWANKVWNFGNAQAPADQRDKEVSLQGLPAQPDHRRVQRGRPEGDLVPGLPRVGQRVHRAGRPRRQRQRDPDPVDQDRARGLGARPERRRSRPSRSSTTWERERARPTVPAWSDRRGGARQVALRAGRRRGRGFLLDDGAAAASGRARDRPARALPRGRRAGRRGELTRRRPRGAAAAAAPAHVRRAIDCVVRCPAAACGEPLDFALGVGDLLVAPYDDVGATYDLAVEPTARAYDVAFRLPTASDLDAADALEPERPERAAAEPRALRRRARHATASPSDRRCARRRPARARRSDGRARSRRPRSSSTCRCPDCGQPLPRRVRRGELLARRARGARAELLRGRPHARAALPLERARDPRPAAAAPRRATSTGRRPPSAGSGDERLPRILAAAAPVWRRRPRRACTGCSARRPQLGGDEGRRRSRESQLAALNLSCPTRSSGAPCHRTTPPDNRATLTSPGGAIASRAISAVTTGGPADRRRCPRQRRSTAGTRVRAPPACPSLEPLPCRRCGRAAQCSADGCLRREGKSHTALSPPPRRRTTRVQRAPSPPPPRRLSSAVGQAAPRTVAPSAPRRTIGAASAPRSRPRPIGLVQPSGAPRQRQRLARRLLHAVTTLSPSPNACVSPDVAGAVAVSACSRGTGVPVPRHPRSPRPASWATAAPPAPGHLALVGRPRSTQSWPWRASDRSPTRSRSLQPATPEHVLVDTVADPTPLRPWLRPGTPLPGQVPKTPRPNGLVHVRIGVIEIVGEQATPTPPVTQAGRGGRATRSTVSRPSRTSIGSRTYAVLGLC